MRIALFSNTYTPHVGGVANSVSALAAWLRGRGHACLVLAPEFEDQPEDETGVVRVPAITNFNRTGFSFRLPSFGLIHRRLEEFQPQVIHSHHPFLLGDAAIREAGSRGLPIVFTHHTRYEDYVHYLFEESETLEHLAIGLATGYANLCDRVIVPGESIHELVTKRGVRVPVSVVPTGIDLQRFAAGDGAAFREANGIPADAPLLGHVGRIEQEKNVEYLAKAAAMALQRDPACWLLLVGEGGRKQAVAQALDEAGVRGRCVLGGWLKGAQLAGAYAAMDVFLFASRSETQGMVLAEAMAAGTPVIAIDAPGARDIVRDDRTGFLLPADAPADAYAAAILRWRGLPQAARQRWRAEMAATVQVYSLDHCMGRLEQIYAELVEGRDFSGNITPWEQLMGRFEAEWDLALEKARAASAALAGLNGG